MKKILIIAASAVVLSLGACTTASSSSNAGLLSAAAPARTSGDPTPEEVVVKMTRKLGSTPVLHITVKDRHEGVDYTAQGWMMKSRAMSEVRRGEDVIFAQYTDGHRIQEYVPNATFANGMEATAVLVEYDKAPDAPVADWPRLIDFDLACGPGCIAGAGWLYDLPDSFLGNMKIAPVSRTKFQGKDCYWYHLVSGEKPDQLTWDFYVDVKTFLPVRNYRRIEAKGKVVKEDTFDFAFEHLPNDSGIHWGLDVDKLRKPSDR